MELRIREVDESAGQPLRQAQGPGSCMVSELVELAVKLREGQKYLSTTP